MAVYIVTYELRKPGKDYKSLYEYLKSFTYCHSSTSCWFIDTAKSTEQVRDGAGAHIDSNDIFFVGRLEGHWNSYRVPCADWLNASARSW
jgi:hypothetical protein